MDLQTILSYVLNVLPAAFLFIVGFVWHTRSTLAKLQEEIKEARSIAECAEKEADDFKNLFSKETEMRREMGIDIWNALNVIKQDYARLETRMEERTSPPQPRRR